MPSDVQQKRLDCDTGKELSKVALVGVSDEQRSRGSRTRPGSVEVAMLIKAAISLHSHVLEHEHALGW